MISSKKEWQPPTVVVAGAGIGEKPGEISSQFNYFLSQAELIVCPERLIPYLNPITDAEKIAIKSPISNVIDRVKKESETRKVMVIASGDPLFYGIGRQLAETLGKNQILILPNLTSVQYLFARLALPWDDVLCFSLHSKERRDFFYWLRQGRKIAILTNSLFSPSFIAELLERYRMGNMVDMAVGEKLGTDEEKISMLSPREASGKEWDTPNIVALLPKRASEMMGGFIPEEKFLHERGMITKREVRAVIVSALRLNPGDVLWDLGAGSGSVSVEASYSVPLKAVYAVEKNTNRYEQLLENIRQFHCGEIIAHHGDSLELIPSLPDPDKIFIGGGGKDLSFMLKIIFDRFGKDRIPPTVISAVLWDSVKDVIQTAKDHNVPVSVSIVQISRSVPILDSFRFESLSPVFLIKLNRENTKS